MRINHNIASLNTYRQLATNNTNGSKSLEKLSSGLRINRAGDDAAGLAISEKMRGQIRGLDQAARNSQDGISLIQTAEGALNETHSILQRMRELAVQSANDTNNTADRGEIQKEMDQLVSEVDRIATTTEFNTKKLLNGDSGNKVIYSSNADVAAASATNDNIQAGTYAVAVTTAAQQAVVGHAGFTNVAAVFAGTQSITINGQSVNFTAVNNDAAQTMANFNAAVNSSALGITASGTNVAGNLTSNEYGVNQIITVTASALTAAMGLTTDAVTDATASGVDVVGTINAAAATGNGRTLISTSGNSIGLRVTLSGTAAGAVGAKGNVQTTKNALTAHIGATEGQTMTMNINSMTAVDLAVNGIRVDSQGAAETALTTIQTAIERVSTERSKLGAYQNRLEHTINNLGTTSENLAAAESRIRDVDMAKEMTEYTKNNILSQAATAMLAQANQAPQGVLQLLK